MSEDDDDLGGHWQTHQDLKDEGALPMWAIYRPPVEGFDGKLWVARLWATLPEPVAHGTAYYTATTLDGVRAKLPEGLRCSPRSPGDDPSVAETWL